MPRTYTVCNTLGLRAIQEHGGLLRARTGHDFKDYKERTLVRRMQVLQIIDVPAFIERLRQDRRKWTHCAGGGTAAPGRHRHRRDVFGHRAVQRNRANGRDPCAVVERARRPARNRPAKEGFGLGFVRRSVEYELAGTVEMAFDMTGLQSTIRFPLARGPQTEESTT